MKVEQKTLFKCETCGKEETGGDWYLALPQGWNYHYFNHLGSMGNEKRDYCSETCFVVDLDGALQSEKESRLASFRNV